MLKTRQGKTFKIVSGRRASHWPDLITGKNTGNLCLYMFTVKLWTDWLLSRSFFCWFFCWFFTVLFIFSLLGFAFRLKLLWNQIYFVKRHDWVLLQTTSNKSKWNKSEIKKKRLSLTLVIVVVNEIIPDYFKLRKFFFFGFLNRKISLLRFHMGAVLPQF